MPVSTVPYLSVLRSAARGDLVVYPERDYATRQPGILSAPAREKWCWWGQALTWGATALPSLTLSSSPCPPLPSSPLLWGHILFREGQAPLAPALAPGLHFVWLVRSPGTVYHWTFVRHLHYQRSKTRSRNIFSHVPTSLTNCFQSTSCNIVRRPCSDSSHVTAPYKLSFHYHHYYYGKLGLILQ